MIKKIYFVFFLLFTNIGIAQNLVINELDCDTPGIDDKEFLELKSSTPNYNLDGYLVVFYNCAPNAGNTAYMVLSLDGYTTDPNGLLLIGSVNLIPYPQYIIPINVIQNGQDAIAIYKGNLEDFPLGSTPEADSRLIDAIVYGTNDPEATSVLEIFRSWKPDIEQLNEGTGNNPNSIMRNNAGGYFVGTPTPRRPNDGSGIDFNGIRPFLNKTLYQEGDTIIISLLSDRPVEKDVLVEASLVYENFNAFDYEGISSVVLYAGSSEAKITLYIIDDNINEGDEDLQLFIKIDDPDVWILQNNIIARVEDNDFIISNFGTPLNPTYGRVKKLIPSEYYDQAINKKGAELISELQAIIANPRIVRSHSYNDIIDILKEADQNPENSNQVWQLYIEKPKSKIDFQIGSDNTNKWNREHVWPVNRAGYYAIDSDRIIDGKSAFVYSHPDSLRHGYSDGHGLRAADAVENSRRGNSFYGEYNGPQNTAGSWKGDVARSIFYLAIRYNGLEVVNGYPQNQVGKFGDLETMLEWHRQDPPDDYEVNRNNIVMDWQFNRNPFIDNPELVDYIWGDKKDQTWQGPSNITSTYLSSIKIYPNPASDRIFIDGIDNNLSIHIHDLNGKILLQETMTESGWLVHNLPNGYYLILFCDSSYPCHQKKLEIFKK